MFSARARSAKAAIDVALAMVSLVRAKRGVVTQPAIGSPMNEDRPNAFT